MKVVLAAFSGPRRIMHPIGVLGNDQLTGPTYLRGLIGGQQPRQQPDAFLKVDDSDAYRAQ